MQTSFRLRSWFFCVLGLAPATAALAAMVLLGTACGDAVGPVAPTDSGTLTDVTIVDAIAVDAGPVDSGSDGGTATDSSVLPMCSVEVCDPTTGMGCPAGGTCVVSRGAAHCETEAGSIEMGMPCEEANSCAPGLSCFQGPDGGICAKPCCESDSMATGACGDGQACVGSRTLVDESASSWAHCSGPRACEVLRDDCDPGQGCYIVSGEGETLCSAAGVAGDGEACERVTDCTPGYFCAGLAERTCRRICRLGEDDCSDSAQRCQVYSYSPEGTGVCTTESGSNRAP